MVGAAQGAYGQLAPYGSDYGVAAVIVASIIGATATLAGGGISLFQQHKAQATTLAGVQARIAKLQRKYAKTRSERKRERIVEEIRELEARAEALRAGLQQIEATAAASPTATSLPPATSGASQPSIGTPIMLGGLFLLGVAALLFVFSSPGAYPSRPIARRRARARAA